MKLITIAMMRPDLTIDELRVRSYKELIDRIMLEVANRRVPPVLVKIEQAMK